MSQLHTILSIARETSIDVLKDITSYTKHLVSQLWDTWLFAPFFTRICSFATAFLLNTVMQVSGLVVAIVLLIVLDVWSGYRASKVRGEEFVMRKFTKGFTERFLIYFMILTVGIAMDAIMLITAQSIPFFNVVYDKRLIAVLFTGMMGVHEGVSILKNMHEVYPKYAFLGRMANFLTISGKNIEKKATEIIAGEKIDDPPAPAE